MNEENNSSIADSGDGNDSLDVDRPEMLRTGHRSIHAEITDRSRRGVLKKTLGAVGASLASSFGLSTSAAADVPPEAKLAKEAAAEYDSEAKVRGAVRQHASELLRELADCGYIDNSSPSELPVSRRFSSSMNDFFDADEGTVVIGTVKNGTPRTRIQLKRQLDDGQTLIVVIKPQTGDSYAVLPDGSADGGPVSIRSGDIGTEGDTGGEDSPCGCYCMNVDRTCGWSCLSSTCTCTTYHICLDTNCDCCWTDHDCTTSCSDYSCP